MDGKSDRRKWQRQALEPPELGYLLTQDPGSKAGPPPVDPPVALYVDLVNKSRRGAAVKVPRLIEPETAVRLLSYDDVEKLWYTFQGNVIWVEKETIASSDYMVGLEITEQEKPGRKTASVVECPGIPDPSDFEFIRQTSLFASIPRKALCSLLNSLTYREVKAGERFIRQGESGDYLFVVQEGACVAYVEKDQETHIVGRLGRGDVVGEMALLTGEPRSAHVEAETDLKLWGLSRRRFDTIAGENPDLRSFLTKLVADRFSGRKLTAERAIGKYIITDIIGRGGYSIVYKGVHAGLNMPVAIKMMRHNLAMDPKFLDNFQREAEIIANLNHENIIKVYDIEKLFRTVFIIMELGEGETIKELIQREKQISYPMIVRVLIQLCRALTYAHQQGIVHRDVKPANMFIKKGDRVKLLDFGLSCTTGSQNLDFSGTVAFMSPEEIEGETVDHRSDIYALGITTYEMLTGQRPFPEDDFLSLIAMHLEQDIPDPADIRPDIPEALRQFVLKACARKPGDRYQRIDEALEILLPLARQLGLAPDISTKHKKSLTTLHLIYEDGQRLALKQLLEDFNTRARKIGVELKAAEFPEI